MTRRLQTQGQRRLKMKEIGRSIVETLASSIDSLTAAVTDYKVCGEKAKIRVAVVAGDGITKSDILEEINNQFNGKLRAVARSFKVEASNYADPSNVRFNLIGYVVPNVEIISASSRARGAMREVASNMFLDSSDCIWNKTGDFLYRKSDVETAEELNHFLTECSAATSRIKRSYDFETVTASSGDFVSYMSKGEMCYGFVIASDESGNKLMVLAEGEDDPEVIDTFDVQDTAIVDDAKVRFPEETEMVEVSSANVNLDAIISYYKRWFQYNPAYAQQLIDRLKSYVFV